MDGQGNSRHGGALELLEHVLADESAEPTHLPLSLLENITKGFSIGHQIGTGGFAVVYKGIVGKGMVAVKKLTKTYDMPESEFHKEIECLMKAKHKNVVRILGYCDDTQGIMANYQGKPVMAGRRNWLLCLEYVPNGSLENYITGVSSGLDWKRRYGIIKGICKGLHYLHENYILHLDLKPANILLDRHLVPKISDFGLSRCLAEGQTPATTKHIRGTPGYLAPELYTGKITFASDIYSLGVLIMEILAGVKQHAEDENLVESWMNRLEASEGNTQLEQVKVCIGLGIQCLEADPKKRPSARSIIDRLEQTASTHSSDDDIPSSSTSSSIELRIESRNNGLEMQSVNNKGLVEELEKLLERLRVPQEFAASLTRGSFEESRMLKNVEACEWLTGAIRRLEVPNLDLSYVNMRASLDKSCLDSLRKAYCYSLNLLILREAREFANELCASTKAPKNPAVWLEGSSNAGQNGSSADTSTVSDAYSKMLAIFIPLLVDESSFFAHYMCFEVPALVPAGAPNVNKHRSGGNEPDDDLSLMNPDGNDLKPDNTSVELGTPNEALQELLDEYYRKKELLDGIQEEFYAVVDWAYKIDPFRCISMHGITERYLSRQKADAAGFVRKLLDDLESRISVQFSKFIDEACHQIERHERNVRQTGILAYIPRFAVLASRMEQYIQGQSRDLINKAYAKLIPFQLGLSKIDLRRVLKSSLSGIDKSIGAMHKRLRKTLTSDELFTSLWDKFKKEFLDKYEGFVQMVARVYGNEPIMPVAEMEDTLASF